MDYLVLGLVAGLAAIERKGFLQAMLSRPIALGPLVGWALGDLPAGLRLGPPLELFWLGAVNLGAAVPAHEAAGTCAIVGGAVLAGRALGMPVGLDVAVLAVLVAAPIALIGRKADRTVEGWNEHIALLAESSLAHHHAAWAVRVNLLGLALPFLIGAVLAPLGAAVAAALIPAVLRTWPGLSVPLRVGFLVFGAVACAAGAKALRARLAPRAFFIVLAAGLLLGVCALVVGGLP